MILKGGTMDLSCGVSAVRQEPEITWSGGDYTNLVATEFVSKAKSSTITITGTTDTVYTCLFEFALNNVTQTTSIDVIGRS